ncbi:MAG: glutathione S-transferase [Hellea sp.]|nr:glutathione S-transferase [Hellea sp.]
MTSTDYILYGMQASLFTGKARAYMRRNRIPVTERGAGHSEFMTRIYSHMQRFIMPVIESPEGDIIQDGTDILEYLERRGLGHEPLFPEDPVTKAVSLLFQLFGNEGLLRPAMHYRWNFDDDNLAFLKVSFRDVMPVDMGAKANDAGFDHASGRMRKAAKAFGVFDESIKLIEESYAEFLALFSAHLERSFFLLGDRPTIGDYGLFNPLYAHLARDPKPTFLMKTTAPLVWNWVERMNRPEVTEEHTLVEPKEGQYAVDELPETLTALMRYVGEEYAAEFSAQVDFTDNWLADQGENPEKVKAPLGRGIGFAAFEWRGIEMSSVVMPYRFYLAQRLWDHFDSCSENTQADIRSLFAKTGLEPFLDKRPSRRVLRKDYHEVWA